MSALEQLRQDRLHSERTFREYVLLLESLLICLTGVGVTYLIVMPDPDYRVLIVLAPITVAALAGLPVTWGVYRMQPWARRPLLLICLCGLPFFPFGTIFAANILLLGFTGPQPQLLTPEYYGIVCKTKHLNARTSFLTWVGFVLIVLLLISVVAIVLLPSEVRL